MGGLYAALIVGLAIALFLFVRRGKGKNLIGKKNNDVLQNGQNTQNQVPVSQQTAQWQPQPIYIMNNPPVSQQVQPTQQPMQNSQDLSQGQSVQSQIQSTNAYNNTIQSHQIVPQTSQNNIIDNNTINALQQNHIEPQYPLIFASRSDPNLFIEELPDRLMYYRRNGRNMYCEGIVWKENLLQRYNN